MRFLLALIFFLIGCYENKISEKTLSNKTKTDLKLMNQNKSIDILKIDSLLFYNPERWNEIVNLSNKFNDITAYNSNNKSKIKSISVDLKQIDESNIPFPFNTPAIIGRLKVLKTYVYKVDLYKEQENNAEIFIKDFNLILNSYNFLINQINIVAREFK
tara:strand:- start:394 stop:870 length:477 start_codon:yes stop_codon:yes gene_type:complete